MVKTTANNGESQASSGVMTSTSRSFPIKKTTTENKASPELVRMLRVYASRMKDPSSDANTFFEGLKIELDKVLRFNCITPPKNIKIISTTGMIFGPSSPPKRQRAYCSEDIESRPESALNIGVLWKTKDNGEKNDKTRLSYSEFLNVEVQPSTGNIKIDRVVMSNERTALNSITRTDEVANILVTMGV
jgi:hypothetical protein